MGERDFWRIALALICLLLIAISLAVVGLRLLYGIEIDYGVVRPLGLVGR